MKFETNSVRGRHMKFETNSVWADIWSLKQIQYGQTHEVWNKFSMGRHMKFETNSVRADTWSLKQIQYGQTHEVWNKFSMGRHMKFETNSVRADTQSLKQIQYRQTHEVWNNNCVFKLPHEKPHGLQSLKKCQWVHKSLIFYSFLICKMIEVQLCITLRSLPQTYYVNKVVSL
jgi:hypothetical protein